MSCSCQSDTIEKTMTIMQKSIIVARGTSPLTTMPNISHSAKTLNCVVEHTKFNLFHGRQSESTVVFNFISQQSIDDVEDPALIRLCCSCLTRLALSDVNRILRVALNSQISQRCYSRY